MEESAFLIAVHRVVGRIQIKHYLRWRLLLALQKQIDQQNVDHLAISDYLLVTITLRRRWLAQLQAVQRAGTGQSVTAVTFPQALRAGHIGTTTGQRQSAVVAQSVMVALDPHSPPPAPAPAVRPGYRGDARPVLDRDGH